MKIIGLTGSIASGKTYFVDYLKQRLPLMKYIDFDILGRKYLELNSPIWKDLLQLFNNRALLPNGGFNKKIISDIIFNSPSSRSMRIKLENLLHPLILQDYFKILQAGEDYEVVIVSIPLLFECHLEHLFDKTILIYCNDENQLSRLMKRNRIDSVSAKHMISAQASVEYKLNLCDYSLSNDGTKEEFCKNIEKFWDKIHEELELE